MNTTILFDSRALTRNGGDGLCWVLTFFDITGNVVDRCYCGTEDRAKQLRRMALFS